MINLHQIADTLEQFPAILRSLLAGYDDAHLRWRPAAEEWSVCEVIGHLIEADRDAFQERVAAIVAGNSTIAPVSPTAPVAEKQYQTWALETLLAAFTAQRAISAEFVRTLDAAQLSKTAVSAKYGTFTAGDFVAEWPYHDLVHLKQIADNLRYVYTPAMSLTMQTALGVA